MTDAIPGSGLPRKTQLRVLSITPVLNEEQRIGRIVEEIPRDWVETSLVVDDGSSDRTPDVAREAGAEVVRHSRNQGVGAAIRSGIDFALERNYDAVVITSGSGKTRSGEIPRLVKALEERDLDMAQGSRYVPGGYAGNMPLQRQLGTRGYSLCFSLLVGRTVTDASSGFRAMRARFLRDPRLHLHQEWLDRYELEPYLLYKVIRLGFRMEEVPVSIEYPPPVPGVPYTRIRALVDWWRLIRPAVFLRLGLRN